MDSKTSSPNRGPYYLPPTFVRAVAVQFADLLDERHLAQSHSLVLDATAILLGAKDWAAYRASPDRFPVRADCRQLNGQAVLDFIGAHSRPWVGPGTLTEVLDLLDLTAA